MMNPTNRLDEFLFRVFRDSARRILWPVAGGDRFERFEECAALFTPEIKGLAVTALSTGDTRSLDDAVDRVLYNLHADFGYDTAKPQWWTDEAPAAQPVEPQQDEGKRTSKRVTAIVEAVKRLGYDPAAIAYGGKAATKRECLRDPALFTPDTFDTAWKAARKAGLVEVENVETYRSEQP